ncbi:MAG: hypothetical protein VB852_09035 [Deltaproteobacteria bacterium]
MMSSVRHYGGHLAVLLVSLGYFLLFRDYGFQVEDEGTLLFQISRVVSGQSPYADFHTGYAPGYWLAASWLLDLVGGSVSELRVLLAIINACTAMLIYDIARRAVGTALALLPALGWVALIPVPIGEFASFNVPYPAWFATLTWMFVPVGLLSWARTGSRSALVLVGLAAAASFSIKPNAGAYAMAAAVWVVAALGKKRGRLDETVAAVAGAAMLLGVWAALGFRYWGADAGVHLPAAVAVAYFWSRRPVAGLAPLPTGAAGGSLVVLAVAFGLPTLLWVLPTVADLGIGRFLREVLFVGSTAPQIYHRAHPEPELWGVVAAASVLAVGIAGHLVRSDVLRLRHVVTAGAGLAGVILAYLWSTALMPEGLATSIATQLENSAFMLAPATHLAGVGYLLIGGGTRGSRRTRLWLYVMVPVATAMYIQLYPRTDFMHLALAVPATGLLGVVLLRRVMSWWSAALGQRGPFLVSAVVAAAALFAVLPRVLPSLDIVLSRGSADEVIEIGGPVSVWVESSASDDLAALAMAVDYLAERTVPGEQVLAFPALGGALFGAGLMNAVSHDYWYAGFPGLTEEKKELARLRRVAPRYAITLNDGWSWFINAPPYFLSLHAHVTTNYGLVARFGRYDLLERRDFGILDAPLVWQPTGPMQDVFDQVSGRRRQAVRRWMSGLRVPETRRARLPAAPAQAILLLRALRDGGDLRTLAWLEQGLGHANARIRGEALAATIAVLARFDAARHRWAADLDGSAYFEYLEPHVATVYDQLVLLTGGNPWTEQVAEEFRRAVAATAETMN